MIISIFKNRKFSQMIWIWRYYCDIISFGN